MDAFQFLVAWAAILLVWSAVLIWATARLMREQIEYHRVQTRARAWWIARTEREKRSNYRWD
jgi:Flp pilus assembly protein TadB